MGMVVVKVANGLPVSNATSGYGNPCYLSTGGYGVGVTVVTAGGLPIVDAGGPSGGIFLTPTAFDLASVTDTALSNNNLTATHTTVNTNSGARSISLQTTGKYYFEITLVTGHGAFDTMGLMSAGVTYNNFGIAGAGTNCLSVSRGGGVTVNATILVTAAAMGAFAAGNVCAIAVDLAGHKAWVRRNAGNWNADVAANPATGTNGLTIPSVALAPGVCFVGSGTAISDAYTANFGTTAFVNAAPSGFTGWPA